MRSSFNVALTTRRLISEPVSVDLMAKSLYIKALHPDYEQVMKIIRGPGIWKRGWRHVVAVAACLGILFSTLVNATSHAAHAGHGHAPHTIAAVADTDQVADVWEHLGEGHASKSDQRNNSDTHGLLDSAHCCLAFVWLPIPELIAPQVHRLSLVRWNDAARATVYRDFDRPPKPLL